MRLDFDTYTYLRGLVAVDTPRRGPATSPEQGREVLADLVQRWMVAPAMLVTPWMDVVARNGAADALYDGLPLRDNLARMAFLDEKVADLFPDPAHLAQCTVATLRANTGPEPHAPEMVELIGELALRSETFRRLWARHDVHRKGSALKSFRHPVRSRCGST